MTIQSLEFLGFTTAVLVLYYLLSRKKQNYLLLAASYFFYITISYYFALVLLFMTVGNYLLGKKIEKEKQPKKWLYAGIGFNLLVLVFFKTANFFVPDILSLLSKTGFHFQTAGLQMLLPIGLSFYTLQALSYLVDVYREQMPVCLKPVDFALYLAYFPKLTAGPIERAQTFLPKLAKRRLVDNRLLSRSFTLIIIGLVRKVVVADTLLGAIPGKILTTPLDFSTIELAAWMLVSLFGIYNDFCGYTNIVRGVSGFFGIELSRNFINPFFSRNFNEFWNRWHVTLSLWLRDYIYFPISRALVRRNQRQNNTANIILPPMAAMIASGLWHGFNLNFMVCFALIAMFMIAGRLLSLRKPLVPPDRKPLHRQLLTMVTIPLLVTTAMIFAIMNPSDAIQFFKGLVTNIQWVLPDSRVFIMIVPAFGIDLIQHRSKNELAFLSYPLFTRAMLLALALLAIFLFSRSRIPAPFVYQGF